MAYGPEAGLRVIDAVAGKLDGYLYLHAARAELLRSAGQLALARDAFGKARVLARSVPERQHIERRLQDLDGSDQ